MDNGAFRDAFQRLVSPVQDPSEHAPLIPFLWQERLFRELAAGHIPRSLDIPTGLGKTSAMAIWLLARAAGQPLPRRLVYVVDRRTVVDQATSYAETLRANLQSPRCIDLREALGLSGPLRISTLRGQHADNREWLEDPSQPAIIIGTVDMIGSRLLFQGYGVSPGMRPMHAGLLAMDSLLLLDEAHLSQPFERMARSLGRLAGEGGMKVMALSATQAADPGRAFALTAEERAEPAAARRLEARKRLTIEDRPGADAKAFAEAAWTIGEAHPGSRIVVFQDRFDQAVAIGEDLAKRARSAWKTTEAVGMLTGQRRGRERDHLADWLTRTGFTGGSAEDRAHPVFLVATSAGEVGVDLDAEHMLCDLVSWERMVQRLGRVNRRGDGDAEVRVWDTGPESGDAEAAELRRMTRRLFEELPGETEKQAGPAALGALAGHPEIGPASTPAPLYPALLMPVVEAWSMTSLPEHAGRPEVGPWLRGWEREDPPQTVLAWRQHLPVRASGSDIACDERDLARYLEIAPLRPSERLETRTLRVVAWLRNLIKARGKQANEAAQPAGVPSDIAALVLGGDGRLKASITYAELETYQKRDWDGLQRRLSGSTLLLRAGIGGLDENGLLAPKAAGPVETADASGATGFDDFRITISALEGDEDGLKLPDQPGRLGVFVTRLDSAGQEKAGYAVYRRSLATPDGAEAQSVRRVPQTLREHTAQVVARVRAYADRLDLELAAREALLFAAEHHDAGKAAGIWQRAAGAAGAPEPLAKTDGRRADWTSLGGYRHEFGSLVHLEERNDLPTEARDLVLHLVAAHHGRARPLIPVLGCADAPPSRLERIAGEAALRYARLSVELGPWRLAWLEAILRAADQQASRDAEEKANG